MANVLNVKMKEDYDITATVIIIIMPHKWYGGK